MIFILIFDHELSLKGQLILKEFCLFFIFKYILQKTNEIFAIATKSGRTKKINALSWLNNQLCVFFCFNQFLEARAEICKKIVGFLEYL